MAPQRSAWSRSSATCSAPSRPRPAGLALGLARPRSAATAPARPCRGRAGYSPQLALPRARACPPRRWRQRLHGRSRTRTRRLRAAPRAGEPRPAAACNQRVIWGFPFGHRRSRWGRRRRAFPTIPAALPGSGSYGRQALQPPSLSPLVAPLLRSSYSRAAAPARDPGLAGDRAEHPPRRLTPPEGIGSLQGAAASAGRASSSSATLCPTARTSSRCSWQRWPAGPGSSSCAPRAPPAADRALRQDVPAARRHLQRPFIVNDDPHRERARRRRGPRRPGRRAYDRARDPRPDALIGLSTHSPEQVVAAHAQPVDYISVGPVWETPTKEGRAGTGPRRSTRRGRRRCRGSRSEGLTPRNVAQVVAAGAADLRGAGDPRRFDPAPRRGPGWSLTPRSRPTPPDGEPRAQARRAPSARRRRPRARGTAPRPGSRRRAQERDGPRRRATRRGPELRPLAEGERPRVVVVGAAISAVIALIFTASAVVAAIGGVEIRGSEPEPLPLAAFS